MPRLNAKPLHHWRAIRNYPAPSQPNSLRLSFRTTSSSAITEPGPPRPKRNPRWLSEQKARLGKCITFGLGGRQIQEAGHLARTMGEQWQGLAVGAEGFRVSHGSVEDAWEEKVLWGEMDSMIEADAAQGHVNNVQYLRYAESSRIWYFRRLAAHVPLDKQKEWKQLLGPSGLGLILKAANIDFLFPLQYPDHLSLYHSMAPLPSSAPITSFQLRCWVLSHQHQRPAARIAEDLVIYDYRLGKKAELPPWMEAVLRTTTAEEADCEVRWQAERRRIETSLQDLENRSIYSGQKVDLGSSS